MTYYLHETPGRLRLRTPILKKNTLKTQHVTLVLLAVKGVKNVTTRPATGSVTIEFCPRTICPSFLINLLGKQGLIHGIIGFPRSTKVNTYSKTTPDRNALKLAEFNIRRTTAITPTQMSLSPNSVRLDPKTKKILTLAAKIILPILAERAFGKIGKEVVSTLLT